MRRGKFVIPVGLLLAALSVCLLAWKLWPAPQTFASAEELGYYFWYEYDPTTQHIHQSNPDRDGKEYVGLTVQGHYSVLILDGTLFINREAHGTVRKGDQIKVTLDRRVWVNGAARKPQPGTVELPKM